MKSTKKLVVAALMVAVIAICSWISIPMTIPFTLQTFAVFISLLILGGMYGTIAILVYLLLGLVGVPVFAGFNAGLGALMGPTGGYLIAFALMGLEYWLTEKLFTGKCKKNLYWQLPALIIGLIICYAFGSVWFALVYTSGGGVTFMGAVTMCVLPYIVPDLAKMALAIIIGLRLRKVIKVESN